mmetsp:Transcript_13274/g.28182  ORF Transcript_13274/g.28182 Transcript_13274/m.28182 type:complete len:214 (-) Transcript_13274:469-1110(-)
MGAKRSDRFRPMPEAPGEMGEAACGLEEAGLAVRSWPGSPSAASVVSTNGPMVSATRAGSLCASWLATASACRAPRASEQRPPSMECTASSSSAKNTLWIVRNTAVCMMGVGTSGPRLRLRERENEKVDLPFGVLPSSMCPIMAVVASRSSARAGLQPEAAAWESTWRAVGLRRGQALLMGRAISCFMRLISMSACAAWNSRTHRLSTMRSRK